MDTLLYLYVVLVIGVAALAGIAVRTSGCLPLKLAAVGLTAMLFGVGYASEAELLGRPKPVSQEWALAKVPEATVIASELKEDEAIYLWLALDGETEPRAYRLPWNLATAVQLQKARQQAEAEGTGVRMRHPFVDRGDPDGPLFYAEPQPALPEKSGPAQRDNHGPRNNLSKKSPKRIIRKQTHV